ncbi:hypothetical protein GGF32_000018 [Allomyces javanicus]|nr:hypothetical protein GGF32_000018 [Allomyces javanicus]
MAAPPPPPPAAAGCPACGAPASALDVTDAGEQVCTACSTVLADTLLSTAADLGVAPDTRTGASNNWITPTRPGPALAGLRPALAGSSSGTTARDRVHIAAHQDLRATCTLLHLDDLYATAKDLLDMVLADAGFRGGLPARLAGVACAILLARARSHPAAAHPLSHVAAQLNVDVYLMGPYLHACKHVLAARGLDEYARAPDHEADLQLLALHYLDVLAAPDMPPALQIPRDQVAAVQKRTQTILRAVSETLRGRHVGASALAVVLVAREAVDSVRHWPRFTAPHLGLAPATVARRVRDVHLVLAQCADPLPWRASITPGNLVHFLGQILDLLDCGVLPLPGTAVDPPRPRGPSTVPAAFRLARNQRREMTYRVHDAADRLRTVGIDIDVPPVNPHDVGTAGIDEDPDADVYWRAYWRRVLRRKPPAGGDDVEPPPPPRILDEVDMAIESLLVHGVPAVQVRDLSVGDAVKMSEAVVARQQDVVVLRPEALEEPMEGVEEHGAGEARRADPVEAGAG